MAVATGLCQKGAKLQEQGQEGKLIKNWQAWRPREGRRITQHRRGAEGKQSPHCPELS